MRYIDLRSDTTTLPTQEMRTAMANAEVGDDIYGDDPTVKALEALSAKILGMEAAIFVPSGTMGNQISIMAHTRRGEEIICEAEAHIVQHERAAVSALSQVMPRSIETKDGTIDITKLKAAIRAKNLHYPKTSLICLENALSNGRVTSLSYMAEVSSIAKEAGIATHLDGARLFNATSYLNCDASEVAKHFDSVTFCISKGLCAPVGAIIAGKHDFIETAIEHRKTLGGAMRQSGIIAAAGIVALNSMRGRLRDDHENALYFADKLLELGYVELDKSAIHINMIFFKFKQPLEKVAQLDSFLLERGIKINPSEGAYGDAAGVLRFVTHHGVTRSDIDSAIAVIKEYFEK